MRLIFFIILSTLPFIIKAQILPEIRIGIDGTSHPLQQDTLTERIKLDVFKQDPKIIIDGGQNTYGIKSYRLFILPVRGDIWGPAEIYGENANDILNNKTIKRISPSIKERLSVGDKIAIENIATICLDCKQVQKTSFSSIFIILE